MNELIAAQDGFDTDAQCAALRPGANDTVFALGGAGDHVLALLGTAPKLVIACDARPAQTHLLELKLAGLKALAHGEYLELLGAKESRRRRGLYHRVQWLLSAEAGAFWTAHLDVLEAGVLSQGRRERALAGFRRFVSLVQGAPRIERYLALGDPQAQIEALRREWDGFVWRRFAGYVLAGAIGAGDSAACLRRLEEAMTATPARENALLSWLLAGRYATARPLHLREGAFDALKVIANRVIVVCDRPDRALAALPDQSVDAFALGDGMDSVEDVEAFARQMGRTGAAGSRVAGRTDRLPRRWSATALDDRTPTPGVFWIAPAGQLSEVAA
jgi:S-adenosylmethionine-diacylglycerol 3-amino-3-carboxypropyl transferase